MRNVTDNLFYETSRVVSSYLGKSICLDDIKFLRRLDDRKEFRSFINSLMKFNFEYISKFSLDYNSVNDTYTIKFSYNYFLRPIQFDVLSRFNASLVSVECESHICYVKCFYHETI